MKIFYVLIMIILLTNTYNCNPVDFKSSSQEKTQLKIIPDNKIEKILEITGQAELKRNFCSEAYQVKLIIKNSTKTNSSGSKASSVDVDADEDADVGVSVNLESNQQTSFYSDPSCSTEITSLTILPSSNTGEFYIRESSDNNQLFIYAKAEDFKTAVTPVKITDDQPPQVINSEENTGTAPPEPVAPLSISNIEDKAVNTGETMSSLSETLEFEVFTEGGKGSITMEYTITPHTDRPTLRGNLFIWRPGFVNTMGQYDNQVGTYNITITAKDEAENQASTSFQIQVKPIKLILQDYDMSEGSADYEYFSTIYLEIHESLHPNRRYNPIREYHGQELLSQTCKSFVRGSPDINLVSPITITNTNIQENNRVYEHKFQMDIPAVIGGSPYARMVFMMKMRFEPVPNDSISSTNRKAKTLSFTLYGTNCINSHDQDLEACQKSAVTEHGMENYFYCSNYFSTTNEDIQYERLKEAYCSHATMSGVSTSLCN